MVFGGVLVHPGCVFRSVFGNDDGKITGGKEKGLVPEETGDSDQGHRAAVPAKFRKCVSFCNAIGVPCHRRITPSAGITGLTCGKGVFGTEKTPPSYCGTGPMRFFTLAVFAPAGGALIAFAFYDRWRGDGRACRIIFIGA